MWTRRKTYLVTICFNGDGKSFRVLSVEDLNGNCMAVENSPSFTLTPEGSFPDDVFYYIAELYKEDAKSIKIHFNEESC